MKQKPKVLLIENALSITGAFKAIVGVASALKHEVDFYFAMPSSSQVTSLLSQHSFKTIRVPFEEVRKSIKIVLYLPQLLVNSIRLVRYTRRERIDIVHVNDLYNMTGVGIKLFRQKVYLIYHVRLLPDSYARALYPVWRSIILHFADEVICNSQTTKTGLTSDHQKISVIYDPPPDEPPSTAVEQNDEITLLYLANYTRGKGHEHAINALALAEKELPGMRLIMVGGTLGVPANETFKMELEQLARQLGIEASVEFRDFEKDVKGVMSKATIFLNFSESESFSITCLEALHFGVPVIATDSGGPQEFILNDNTGYIVRRGDTAQMADRIIKLASDSEKRKAFVLNGKQLIKQRFDRQLILSHYRQLYIKASRLQATS